MDIVEVSEKDLPKIQELWNNGEVMKYVGFPEGLNIDLNSLVQWLSNINNNPNKKAYAMYDNESYLGELYYDITDLEHVILDIKLLPQFHNQGYGSYGFSYLIQEVFKISKEAICYVDPSIENEKAINLYQKLGFKKIKKEKNNIVLHLTMNNFKPLDNIK